MAYTWASAAVGRPSRSALLVSSLFYYQSTVMHRKIYDLIRFSFPHRQQRKGDAKGCEVNFVWNYDCQELKSYLMHFSFNDSFVQWMHFCFTVVRFPIQHQQLCVKSADDFYSFRRYFRFSFCAPQNVHKLLRLRRVSCHSSSIFSLALLMAKRFILRIHFNSVYMLPCTFLVIRLHDFALFAVAINLFRQ